MDLSVPAHVRADELLTRLRALANPANVAGMARYGINTAGTLGVSVTRLREVAKDLRTLRKSSPEYVHEVAAALWASGIHEAYILAGILDVPSLVTREQAESWVSDFDSWDVCDQVSGLFAQTSFAFDLVEDWTRREEEFVKRSGFVVMCHIAVHEKSVPDERIVGFLVHIERHATDSRPYVKRGVNWALRQIGKRSVRCHMAAVSSAESLLRDYPQDPNARWVAKHALRELNSPQVRQRLHLFVD